ncbi:MAG: hypothetical protein WB765_19155, partial [Acidimicrobiales bacterium]
ACVSVMAAAPAPAPKPSARVGAPPSTAAQPPSTVSPPSATVPLGVYSGPGGTETAHSFARSAGVEVPYALDYFDDATWQTMTDPVWTLTQWSHTGDKMIWGVPMLPESGATLAEGATGQYDNKFVDLARLLVISGQGSATLALGFYPDQPSSPWSVSTAADAASYVAYWRHIVNAMRQVPGAGFSFAWDLAGNGPVPPTALYPGDTYVDVVATGAIDTLSAAPVDAGSRWSALAWAPSGPQWFASFATAHHKQLAVFSLILVPSSVAGGGGDDPAFVSAFLSWAAQNQVATVVVWDYGPGAIAGGGFPNSMSALAHSAEGSGAPG